MASGGKRPGAGRPKGQGRYGESTKAVRLPESLVNAVMQFVAHKGFRLPLFGGKVSAGFPSPADDFLEAQLDLNEYLVKHPAATFLVRVSGHSMIKAGIHEGDILIVDRNLEPTNGRVVVAALDGELTVKRLKKMRDGKIFLMPENEDYSPIEVNPGGEGCIWGVVTNVIHAV